MQWETLLIASWKQDVNTGETIANGKVHLRIHHGNVVKNGKRLVKSEAEGSVPKGVGPFYCPHSIHLLIGPK